MASVTTPQGTLVLHPNEPVQIVNEVYDYVRQTIAVRQVTISTIVVLLNMAIALLKDLPQMNSQTIISIVSDVFARLVREIPVAPMGASGLYFASADDREAVASTIQTTLPTLVEGINFQEIEQGCLTCCKKSKCCQTKK